MTVLSRLALILFLTLGFGVGCGNDAPPTQWAGPAPNPPEPGPDGPPDVPRPSPKAGANDATASEEPAGATGPNLDAIQVDPQEPPPIVVPPWKPDADLAKAMESLKALKPAAEHPSIAGDWKGFLCRYPHPVGLTLELAAGKAPAAGARAFGSSGFGGQRQPQPFSQSGGFSNRSQGFGARTRPVQADTSQGGALGRAREVGGLQGRLEQTALYEGARRGLGAVQNGDSAVAGVFDAGLGSFSLLPQLDPGRPARSNAAPVGLSGVYIPATADTPEVLVGVGGPGNQADLVVLMRPEAADKMLWQPVREIGEHPEIRGRQFTEYMQQDPRKLRVFKALGPYDQPGPNNPFYTSLLAWAARVVDEYPERKDLSRTDCGTQGGGLNLFEDKYFSQHFGASYFDLTDGEFVWLFYPIATDRSPDKSWSQAMRDYTLLGRAFSLTGTGGRRDIVPRLLAMRELRRYHAHMLNRLEAAAPAPQILEDLAAWEPLALERVKPLWPSEQRALTEAFGAARRRLARPALQLAAAQAVGEARGSDGAKNLANWEARRTESLALLEPADQEQIRRWILERLDVLAAELAQAHVPRVKAFADDLAGLEAMGQWYQQIAQDHAPLLRTKGFETLFEHVRVERERRLARLAPQIGRQIDAAADATAVDGVLERYLAIGADHHCAAGKALGLVARQRKEQLDQEAARALFSEREWRWRQEGKVGPVNEGPTAEEVRLVLLRSIENIGGTMVDAHTAHFRNPLLPVPGAYMEVRIKEVRLLSEPVPIEGSDGYTCVWQATGTAKWPDEFLDHFGGRERTAIFVLQEQLVNAAINSPQTRNTDKLYPGARGWTSPTMGPRGIEGMFGRSR